MPSLLPQHGPDLRAGTTGPASLIPWLHNEGLGRTLRAAATLVERRVDLEEAYDHLRLGVCDGCGLLPQGLRDPHDPRLHLCSRRITRTVAALLPPVAPHQLANPGDLRRLDPDALEALGPIDRPYLLEPDLGPLQPMGGPEAHARAVAALGDDARLVLGPTGNSLEASWLLARFAEALGGDLHLAGADEHLGFVGTLAARTGRPHGHTGLHELQDADVVLVWDAHLVDQHPLLARNLLRAREGGARVVLVGPYRPASLDVTHHGAPVFGAWLLDDHLQVPAGGEVGLAWGVRPGPLPDDGAARALHRLLDGARRVVSLVATDTPHGAHRADALLALHHSWGQLHRGAGLLPVPLHAGLVPAWDLGARSPAPASRTALTLGPAAVRAHHRIHLVDHLHPDVLDVAADGWTLLLPVRPLHRSIDGATLVSAERRLRHLPARPDTASLRGVPDAAHRLHRMAADLGHRLPGPSGADLREALSTQVPGYGAVATQRAGDEAWVHAPTLPVAELAPAEAPWRAEPPRLLLRTLPAPRDRAATDRLLISPHDASALGLEPDRMVRVDLDEQSFVLPIAIGDVLRGHVIRYGAADRPILEQPCSLGSP